VDSSVVRKCRSQWPCGKAWVFGRSLTGIVGWNPTGDMDVCVVFVERTVAWNVKSDMKDERI
jgi:hypothetical protein